LPDWFTRVIAVKRVSSNRPAPEDVALWFGVLYIINMQMSFLSPPFGYALFYIRGVTPPHIQMATIFKAAIVFLIM
jgi:TRAP-type mannitol/chloroaromatic compound transport system permease large subunit